MHKTRNGVGLRANCMTDEAYRSADPKQSKKQNEKQ
jgi:hypothetical protein